MKNYDYEKIQKLVDPIIEMMKEEYPNNTKMVITSFGAEIIYEHTEMIFLNKGSRGSIYEGKENG